MWLLNWLLDNVGRVFSVLDWYYDRVVQAAFNAYNWAVQKANDAYWAAISFAQNVLAIARSYALTLYFAARDFVNAVAASFGRLVVDTLNFLIALFDYAINEARNWLLAHIGVVEQAIINFINGALAGLDAAFLAALEKALGGITYVRELRQDILDIIRLLNKTNRGKLADFFTNGFKVLNLIVTNPGGFVLAFLRAFILPMMEWSLAYSLGAVAVALPPWPDFLKDGLGDITPTPGVPGTPILGLVAPLSQLSISGNRYGSGHPGLDLGCAGNDPVSTMHDGVIEESGFSGVGYGWYVTVRGGQFWTRYAHLGGSGLPVGTSVLAGNVIGLCDSSGNSTGNHLHLEIKQNGIFIDPVHVLGL